MKTSNYLKIAAPGREADKSNRYPDTDKRARFGPIFRVILELAGPDYEKAFTRDDIVAALSEDEDYIARYGSTLGTPKFRKDIIGYIPNPGFKEGLLKTAPKPK